MRLVSQQKKAQRCLPVNGAFLHSRRAPPASEIWATKVVRPRFGALLFGRGHTIILAVHFQGTRHNLLHVLVTLTIAAVIAPEVWTATKTTTTSCVPETRGRRKRGTRFRCVICFHTRFGHRLPKPTRVVLHAPKVFEAEVRNRIRNWTRLGHGSFPACEEARYAQELSTG